MVRNFAPYIFLRLLWQKTITVAVSVTAKQIINSVLIRVNLRLDICRSAYCVKGWLGFAITVEQHGIVGPAAYGHVATP